MKKGLKFSFFLYFLLVLPEYSSFNAKICFRYLPLSLGSRKIGNRIENALEYSSIRKSEVDSYQCFRTYSSRLLATTSLSGYVQLSSLESAASIGQTSSYSLKKELKGLKEEYRLLCKKERDIMALEGSLSVPHKKELHEIRGRKLPVRNKMNQLSEKLEMVLSPNDRTGPVHVSSSDEEPINLHNSILSEGNPSFGEESPALITSWRKEDTLSFKRRIGEREPLSTTVKAEKTVSRPAIGYRRDIPAFTSSSSVSHPVNQGRRDFPSPLVRKPAKKEIDYRFLQGKTLQAILETVIAKVGFEELYDLTRLRAFQSNPSLKSALKFLRLSSSERARKKIEILYCQIMAKGKS
jgi:hypothetical protein